MIEGSALLDALEGDPCTKIWLRLVLTGLVPVGEAYAAAMALRRRLYESGRWRQYSLPIPVISVGNLTQGGTGKTPTVAWAASSLMKRGIRPAVVSRGYGGARGEMQVVGDGEGGVLSSPPAADEAAMLARRFPTLPVLTGRNRPEAGRLAFERFRVEAILLDDGFQHLSLGRSFDLVLLRGDRPFGNGRIFPAGALREPVSALRRAGAILLTGEVTASARAAVAAAAPGIPVHEGNLFPSLLLDGEGRVAGKARDLSGAGVVAVSGIARPDSFASVLRKLGARLCAQYSFPDHAVYRSSDATRFVESLHRTGADYLVSTEKDAVKLSPLLEGIPFRALRVEMRIEEEETLAGRLLGALEGPPREGTVPAL